MKPCAYLAFDTPKPLRVKKPSKINKDELNDSVNFDTVLQA